MLRFIPFSFLLIHFFFVAPTLPLIAQQVVVNEIMFAPATGNAEWVELFNPGVNDVSIRDWSMCDRSGATALLTAEDCTIPAGGYIIIASSTPLAAGWETLPAAVLLPSNFPSLNNSGDDVVLHDADGNTVDSVAYASSWSPQRGVSAERVRHDLVPLRENWAACQAAAGGTPGEGNSVSVPPVDPLPRYSLIINEIMPAPLSSSCEWLELFNPGTAAVDLSRWALAGKADSHGDRAIIALPAGSGEIQPDGYTVIAADSSILLQFPEITSLENATLLILNRSSLSLSNADDEILLLDPSGACIDSIWYQENWHHPMQASTTGISLELMQPDFHAFGSSAWGSCTAPEGGTPGARNSIFTDAPPRTRTDGASLSASPNPFSPDGDGQEDYCVFHCRLPASVNQIRMRIYDVEGRQIVTLRNNQPMGREGVIVWNGLDDEGRRVRVGAFVALLEGIDPFANVVGAAKTVVVVARRL